MLGLSANLNYYLFNGNVDLRKGIFRLCESIGKERVLIDERAYELHCSQLSLANEEKARLRKQNKELIARLESIEKSTWRTQKL